MAWVLRMIEQKPATDHPTGQTIYQTECSACHGSEMKGSPPEFPSLVGISQRYEDDDLLLFIAQGSGRMPVSPVWERRILTRS